MIKTALSQSNIAVALNTEFIKDKQPLRDYAGFELGSKYEGLARQTFSLVLSSESINNIRSSIEILYKQLLSACWPKDKIMPFDMIRFDAFYNSADDSLKIIELNTRNVGLHEIVEWIDDVTAHKLSATQSWSLNKEFVANQHTIQTSNSSENTALLYMTRPTIPKWKYYDELVATYGSVCHVTSPQDYEVTSTGLLVNGITYRNITRKFSWSSTPEIVQLDNQKLISIMQPLWMRDFGHKDYLNNFNSESMLKSELFKVIDIEDYVTRKNTLVLKITNSGGSKSIFLGVDCSIERWRKHLIEASIKPNQWVLQEFSEPIKHDVIAHGIGVVNVPIQLGIFVLPDRNNPHTSKIDIVVKGYSGDKEYFTFDPSGLDADIWFGSVIESTS